MIAVIMGEMADMLIEQMWDDPDDWDGLYEAYGPQTYKYCSYCKTKVYWMDINREFGLVEENGRIHMCNGHRPSKTIVDYLVRKQKRKAEENKFNNLITNFHSNTYLLPYLTDEELLRLYECFVQKQEEELNEYGESLLCNNIKIITTEILSRMKSRL